jgi:hypothetical protein
LRDVPHAGRCCGPGWLSALMTKPSSVTLTLICQKSFRITLHAEID